MAFPLTFFGGLYPQFLRKYTTDKMHDKVYYKLLTYLLTVIFFELMPQTYMTSQLIAFQFNLIQDGEISQSIVYLPEI